MPKSRKNKAPQSTLSSNLDEDVTLISDANTNTAMTSTTKSALASLPASMNPIPPRSTWLECSESYLKRLGADPKEQSDVIRMTMDSAEEIKQSLLSSLSSKPLLGRPPKTGRASSKKGKLGKKQTEKEQLVCVEEALEFYQFLLNASGSIDKKNRGEDGPTNDAHPMNVVASNVSGEAEEEMSCEDEIVLSVLAQNIVKKNLAKRKTARTKSKDGTLPTSFGRNRGRKNDASSSQSASTSKQKKNRTSETFSTAIPPPPLKGGRPAATYGNRARLLGDSTAASDGINSDDESMQTSPHLPNSFSSSSSHKKNSKKSGGGGENSSKKGYKSKSTIPTNTVTIRAGAIPIIMNEQDFLEQHKDHCEVCNTGGELLCCVTCNLVFHMNCVRPVLRVMPPDDWSCAYCEAAGVTGHKREARPRKRAAQAVREMKRMQATYREQQQRERALKLQKVVKEREEDEEKERAEKELAQEAKKRNKGREQVKNAERGNDDFTSGSKEPQHMTVLKEKEIGPNTNSPTDSNKVKDINNNAPLIENPTSIADHIVMEGAEDAAKSTKRQLGHLLDSLSPLNFHAPRTRRARRQPTLFDPQSGAASEWRSDGDHEWKTLASGQEEDKKNGDDGSNSRLNNSKEERKEERKKKKKDKATTQNSSVHSSKKLNAKEEAKEEAEGKKKKQEKIISHNNTNVSSSSKQQPHCKFCNDDDTVAVCRYCGCKVCFGKHDKEHTLLCDSCDAGYHTLCLTPPLKSIPKGEDWFCPSCREVIDKAKRDVPRRNTKSVYASPFSLPHQGTPAHPKRALDNTLKRKSSSSSGDRPTKKGAISHRKPDELVSLSKGKRQSSKPPKLATLEKASSSNVPTPPPKSKRKETVSSSKQSKKAKAQSKQQGSKRATDVASVSHLPTATTTAAGPSFSAPPHLQSSSVVPTPTKSFKSVTSATSVAPMSPSPKTRISPAKTQTTETFSTRTTTKSLPVDSIKSPPENVDDNAAMLRSLSSDSDNCSSGKQMRRNRDKDHMGRMSDSPPIDPSFQDKICDKAQSFNKKKGGDPKTLPDAAPSKTSKEDKVVNIKRTKAKSSSSCGNMSKDDVVDDTNIKHNKSKVSTEPSHGGNKPDSPAEKKDKLDQPLPKKSSLTTLPKSRDQSSAAGVGGKKKSSPVGSVAEIVAKTLAESKLCLESMKRKTKFRLEEQNSERDSPIQKSEPSDAETADKIRPAHPAEPISIVASTKNANSQSPQVPLKATREFPKTSPTLPTIKKTSSTVEEGEKRMLASITKPSMSPTLKEIFVAPPASVRLKGGSNQATSLAAAVVSTSPCIPIHNDEACTDSSPISDVRQSSKAKTEDPKDENSTPSTAAAVPTLSSSPTGKDEAVIRKGSSPSFSEAQQRPKAQTQGKSTTSSMAGVPTTTPDNTCRNNKVTKEPTRLASSPLPQVVKQQPKAKTQPTADAKSSPTPTPKPIVPSESQNKEPLQKMAVLDPTDTTPKSPPPLQPTTVPPKSKVSMKKEAPLTGNASEKSVSISSSPPKEFPLPESKVKSETVAATVVVSADAVTSSLGKLSSSQQQILKTKKTIDTVTSITTGVGDDSSVANPGTEPPVKVPRRKPGARECMQISRRFGVNPIPQKYMDTLLDYCTRGKVEHLIRMRERLDEHSRFLEAQLAGLESLVKIKGEVDLVVPPEEPNSANDTATTNVGSRGRGTSM